MKKIVEGAIAIGVFRGQWHVRKAERAYLDRIRDSMQKPIGDLLALCSLLYIRGAIVKNRTTVAMRKPDCLYR
jgi:hypothetical protein